jgi:hypothetical protein
MNIALAIELSGLDGGCKEFLTVSQLKTSSRTDAVSGQNF